MFYCESLQVGHKDQNCKAHQKLLNLSKDSRDFHSVSVVESNKKRC